MEPQEQLDYENQRAAQQAAANTASQAASRQVSKRLENPEFFQQLRDPDVDSDLFDWVEDELGPIFSGAHIIGNRDETYEREAKWGNIARSRRIIKQGDPGRIAASKTISVPNPETGQRETMHPLLELHQRVHSRPDKDATLPYTRDERRAIRDALEASTALKSLSIDSKGLDSVTQATAVHKTEKNEHEDKSVSEKAASFYG
jgi:hypothetical protein